MTLAAGSRLGAYEILAPIGAGGMGEVFRARDSKLNRNVAIKVLPAALANDADYMARSRREAQVLASLNHPNIAAIYGLEDRAIVMELVEGPTLADRLTRGPLPIDEALPIARQIAEALEAAHEKGIIHRDLKPGNIKITPDGVVKVLDFGLAKTAEASSTSDASTSPTLTIRASHAGMILGTAAYMSPEQAAGKTVDKRADIWSFGVVLFEMLTGRRLFEGETISHTLAQVLTSPIDFSQLPAKTPAVIRGLLHRCLDRDTKTRLRDIGEARVVIAKHLADPKAPAEVVQPPRRSLWFLPWALAALLALVIVTLGFVHFRERPPDAPVQRYTIAPPEGSTVHSFAISPDGRYLAIAAAVNGKRQLWLRPLDALQAQPMQFTEDATFPFWSPDSRYIGFFAQGKLKKVAAAGGPSQSLCDALAGRGGSWGRDDVIVFSPDTSAISIQRVSAAGGVPVDVFKAKGDQRLPVFLPDGRHFLYLMRGFSAAKSGIYVASLDGTENRRILPDNSGAAFAPPSTGSKVGHILFVRENTLMAQPFDLSGLQLAGDMFPLAEGVTLTDLDYAPATVANSGILLYAGGSTAGGLNQIAWYDRAGKLLGPVVPSGPVYSPAISPDQKSVVFQRLSASGADLWVRDLARGTETRFTSDASINGAPFWSPRGDRIVFTASRQGGVLDLFQQAASGSGPGELLVANANAKPPTQWSRDGRFIVYTERDPKTRYDLWVLPIEQPEKERKPVPFLQTGFNELMGQLSPDSHWMAYVSDQSGRREVYVRPFPPTQGQWTISVAGGEQPRWRGDGQELFFVAADGRMMAVPVKATAGPKPNFAAGSPVPLFDAHMAPATVGTVFNYDVTADGRRFLITTTSGSGSASSPLNVVVNWTAGLKK